MKVLVTGGAGYIGSILCRELLDANHEVVCLDKLAFGGRSILEIMSHDNFHFVNCDINNAEHLSSVVESTHFESVLHLAAIVGDPACKIDERLSTRTNWDASKALLHLSLRKGVSNFVFASTCSNYGRMADPGAFVSEESALAPVSLYAELKVRFEQLMLKEAKRVNGTALTSLRFATVYGLSPRMRFDLTVNEFTKELCLSRELIIFGEQFWRPYCHVRDFSQAFIRVLGASHEDVRGEVFNVGATAENYTKKMLATALVALFPDARIKYVAKTEDPRDYRVNCDKIAEVLGFETTRTVPTGMREIKQVLESGVIHDPDNQRYFNTPV